MQYTIKEDDLVSKMLCRCCFELVEKIYRYRINAIANSVRQKECFEDAIQVGPSANNKDTKAEKVVPHIKLSLHKSVENLYQLYPNIILPKAVYRCDVAPDITLHKIKEEVNDSNENPSLLEQSLSLGNIIIKRISSGVGYEVINCIAEDDCSYTPESIPGLCSSGKTLQIPLTKKTKPISTTKGATNQLRKMPTVPQTIKSANPNAKNKCRKRSISKNNVLGEAIPAKKKRGTYKRRINLPKLDISKRLPHLELYAETTQISKHDSPHNDSRIVQSQSELNTVLEQQLVCRYCAAKMKSPLDLKIHESYICYSRPILNPPELINDIDMSRDDSIFNSVNIGNIVEQYLQSGTPKPNNCQTDDMQTGERQFVPSGLFSTIEGQPDVPICALDTFSDDLPEFIPIESLSTQVPNTVLNDSFKKREEQNWHAFKLGKNSKTISRPQQSVKPLPNVNLKQTTTNKLAKSDSKKDSTPTSNIISTDDCNSKLKQVLLNGSKHSQHKNRPSVAASMKVLQQYLSTTNKPKAVPLSDITHSRNPLRLIRSLPLSEQIENNIVPLSVRTRPNPALHLNRTQSSSITKTTLSVVYDKDAPVNQSALMQYLLPRSIHATSGLRDEFVEVTCLQKPQTFSAKHVAKTTQKLPTMDAASMQTPPDQYRIQSINRNSSSAPNCQNGGNVVLQDNLKARVPLPSPPTYDQAFRLYQKNQSMPNHANCQAPQTSSPLHVEAAAEIR